MRARTVLFALSIALVSQVVSAQEAPAEKAPPADLTEAKQLFEEGLALLDAKKYAGALERFQKSRQLVAGKGNTVNAAICLEKLGRDGEALELYEKVLFDFRDELNDEDRSAVAPSIKALRGRVGTVVITGTTGASISVDGRERGRLPRGPLYLKTGEHELRVQKAGFVALEKKLRIEARARLELEARLKPKPKPQPIPEPLPKKEKKRKKIRVHLITDDPDAELLRVEVTKVRKRLQNDGFLHFRPTERIETSTACRAGCDEVLDVQDTLFEIGGDGVRTSSRFMLEPFDEATVNVDAGSSAMYAAGWGLAITGGVLTVGGLIAGIVGTCQRYCTEGDGDTTSEDALMIAGFSAAGLGVVSGLALGLPFIFGSSTSVKVNGTSVALDGSGLLLRF